MVFANYRRWIFYLDLCPSGKALYREPTTLNQIRCTLNNVINVCPNGFSCQSDVTGAYQGYCCSTNCTARLMAAKMCFQPFQTSAPTRTCFSSMITQKCPGLAPSALSSLVRKALHARAPSRSSTMATCCKGEVIAVSGTENILLGIYKINCSQMVAHRMSLST